MSNNEQISFRENFSRRLRLDNWVYSRLAEPFPEEEVKFRVGGGRTLLAYIDARQVVERLNEIVGAENWFDHYSPVSVQQTEIKDITDTDELERKYTERDGDNYKQTNYFWLRNGAISGVKNASDKSFSYNDIEYGGVMCQLTILGVTKSDVGSPSMAEQVKGAYSDALKRAAVKFGVGAYLYELKGLRGGKVDNNVVVEPPELPEWAIPAESDSHAVVTAQMEKWAQVDRQTVDAYDLGLVNYAIDQYCSFGRPDPTKPLIVKRAVYEVIDEVIKKVGQV